jgi:Tfp pilus assembly protein PilO
MKTTSKRILFILLALVFLVASVVVYSSFIQAAYDQVVNLRGELISKQTTYQQLTQTFNQIQSLITEFQNQGDVQRQTSLILPKDRDASYLVGQVVGLAEANGIAISSISTQILPIQPAKSKVIRNIGRIKADINLAGSYAGFKAFARQLENNILILDATDMKIDSTGQAGNGSLNYTVSITSYYQTNQ